MTKLPPDACTLTVENVTSSAFASLKGLSVTMMLSALFELGVVDVLQPAASNRSAAAAVRGNRLVMSSSSKPEYETPAVDLIRFSPEGWGRNTFPAVDL